ncbi:hypothetical protein B0J17DRAFT_625882 [Rhizoctonia solani]|nr:hypothetical protein B0J17DRAFT_625882 [Rhizoctonia solani]
MSTLNYNIPCFAPPVDYQHKIDPNAAWVRSRPPCMTVTTGRNLLPPSSGDTEPKTPWGTPMPIWRPGHDVLVQLYSPDGAWLRGVIVEVLPPLEVADLPVDKLKEISPSRLANMKCRYTVKLSEELNMTNIWTEIEEKFLVPPFLEERLQANAVKFMMGERVLVQTSAGDQERTHIGHISNVVGDKVLWIKGSWHVVPRLYQVFINELNTFGYWTAASIAKIEPSEEQGISVWERAIPAGLITLQAPDRGLTFDPIRTSGKARKYKVCALGQ